MDYSDHASQETKDFKFQITDFFGQAGLNIIEELFPYNFVSVWPFLWV